MTYATTPAGGAKLEYATSKSPAGPWDYKGVILDSGVGATSHHSIVEYPTGSNKWYLFYHTAEMSDNKTNQRNICADRLYYNSDGTIRKVVPTRTGMGTDAYARIKAAYYNTMSGVQKERVSGDIGHNLSYLDNGDWTSYEGVVFENNSSAQTFTTSVASTKNGGWIEIRLGNQNGTLIGQVDVPNTGRWQNWTTVSCKLNRAVSGTQKITLVYKGSGGPLFNVNWFKFVKTGQENPIIPTDIEVSFKSAYNGKFVCANMGTNKDKPLLTVDKDKMVTWEKFEVLPVSAASSIVGIRSAENRHFWNYVYMNPMHVKGGSLSNKENQWTWVRNGDGTISLKSVYSGRFVEFNAYDNKLYVSGGTTPDNTKSKFYVEAHNAPVGCVVALKSFQFNSYVTNDNPAVFLGGKQVGGNNDKFLVVDAGNGYIAFKSMANNQYLRCETPTESMKANGGSTVDSDRERFQWVDNYDGTISLKSIKHNKFLCADNQGKNPIKLYSNRDKVGEWEKFYCQIQ